MKVFATIEDRIKIMKSIETDLVKDCFFKRNKVLHPIGFTLIN